MMVAFSITATTFGTVEVSVSDEDLATLRSDSVDLPTAVEDAIRSAINSRQMSIDHIDEITDIEALDLGAS